MITTFLANPYVSGFGYLLGVVSSIIAIVQVFTISRKNKKISELTTQINAVNSQNNSNINNNLVNQGERSQYFQDNNGSINIDNRG